MKAYRSERTAHQQIVHVDVPTSIAETGENPVIQVSAPIAMVIARTTVIAPASTC